MKHLTQKYWEDIKKMYPVEFEKFMSWLDNYKKEGGEGEIDPNGPSYVDYFIFDLPDAMQIGVFYQFTTEAEKYNTFVIGVGDAIEHVARTIKVWFFEERASFLMQEKKYDAEEDHGNLF